MTSGSSMHAMILIAPPQAGQVSMLMPQSRLSRGANVIAVRRIQTSAFGKRQSGEERSPSARLWPGATVLSYLAMTNDDDQLSRRC